MLRFRVATLIIIATATLAGCAVGPSEFGGGGMSTPSLAASDSAIAKAPHSGLGMASGATRDAGEVAPDTSTKAPKGALADRDYTATRLDPAAALKLINDYRTAKGLAPLKLDARLTVAAKMQSKDLAQTDRISHYGSDGSSPWDRIKRAGYSAKIAAENVGTGQASLEEVFKGWTESPGHNRNLLLPAARDMGIALAEDPKTEFKTFWTLVVASSSQ
jgi:uncharacterized protein YkwD